MKLFLKFFGLLLVVVVFGGTLVFLYHKSQEKPVIFETRSPFVTNIVRKTVATGSIVPRKEIEIKPQISGIIEEIFVEPGDTVKKKRSDCQNPCHSEYDQPEQCRSPFKPGSDKYGGCREGTRAAINVI